MLLGSLEDKIKYVFKIYDLDGNGSVSRNEMLQIVDSIFETFASVLPAGLTSEAVTEELFTMDSDKNGLISQQEFVDGAKQNPIMVSLLQVFGGSSG